MSKYVYVPASTKTVFTVEIVFSGPGSYNGFGETIARQLGDGCNASGVKVIGDRPFQPFSATPEEVAGFLPVPKGGASPSSKAGY